MSGVRAGDLSGVRAEDLSGVRAGDLLVVSSHVRLNSSHSVFICPE